MAETHEDDVPRPNCVLCEVTLDAVKSFIRHLTEEPCHGSLRLKCGHSTCFFKPHDQNEETQHDEDHTLTPGRQPQINNCLSDKIEATNFNEDRYGSSASEGSASRLLCSQSIQNDELALAEHLRSIRDNSVALVELLKSDYLGIQLDIEPFVAALESGRSKPLGCFRKDTSIPQLFDLETAEPDLDPDDVSGAAITDLGRSTIYQGHNNRAPIPYQEKYITDFIGWNCEGLPKYAINIPLPQFSLHPPPEVAARYHVHESPSTNLYAVSADICMKGAVVDIREDRGTLGITAMDNHQMKLWVLYPAQGNRHVFEKESAVGQRFARCEKALINGRFVVTLPGEIIILPPGWLYATLTINRGVLFGSTMTVAEGVSAAAQSYKHDVAELLSVNQSV
ncbi:hypothetical protein J4E82_011681, partial [Alternaria postmessia]|uniref:uncharacterized protein n=1 Tax=Alternaria postmessia TaxID=1187938 RepID=UPI002225B4FD